MELQAWILEKLEAVKDYRRIIMRDPLQLLPRTDSALHQFGITNRFHIIPAETNLLLRQHYRDALDDPSIEKIIVWDRTPLRRRRQQGGNQAPGLFYPDLLARTPPEGIIDLDLRIYLRETTGDPGWPQETNDSHYARLILRHLPGVIRAHQNLRLVDRTRFDDRDFKTIVAFAALGIPESAFKRLDAEAYWKIGLVGHSALEEMETLASEVTRPVRQLLSSAPAPFCWLADQDADMVLRAFYLSAILAQHVPNWNLLLANLDARLQPYSNIQPQVLNQAAPKLIEQDPRQAECDLANAEEELNRAALQLLVEQLKLIEPGGFAAVIEKESYSTLLRSLALLLALENLLSAQPTRAAHERIARVLLEQPPNRQDRFVERRPSVPWSNLKQAYEMATQLQELRGVLLVMIKELTVIKNEKLSFEFFRQWWNDKRLNRLEYLLSALQRILETGELLPKRDDDLPALFANRLESCRKRILSLADEVNKQLDQINSRFQELVAARYPAWAQEDSEVRLTAQFLRRCLKLHWDPQKEKAVVLVFDGMRYDIWDELLRPMLTDRMDLLADYAASSLLPSETNLSRKALSAGAFPDDFSDAAAENDLLKEGLARTFSYQGAVEVSTPDGSGTGETVRYRAGSLEWYIFELCDKELHGVDIKTRQDGRQVPSRPLSFIYQQDIKNMIDTEVMAIVRKLAPGTKVFVTADHGFGRVGRSLLFTEAEWVNEQDDCKYLNVWLRDPLSRLQVPGKVKQNVIEFPVASLRLPAVEDAFDKKAGRSWKKHYASVAFPRVGYAFKRPAGPKANSFNPDAYSHGGISIQEMLIPMVVLQVKTCEEGLITLDPIAGLAQIVEGEEVEFTMRVRRNQGGQDLRMDVEATYSHEPDRFPLPHQIYYVPADGTQIVYRFRPNPDDATVDERREGAMLRTLTITISYKDGRRTVRRSQVFPFTVQLNTDRIIRRVGSLGNILGLTPKNVKG